MKTRLLLTLLLVLPVLIAASPSKREKVKVDGKEYPVYVLIEEVKPLSVENPVYPYRAKQEGRGGETLVGAVVGEKGNVTATFVAKSTGAVDIQQAACAAVRQWRFPKLKEEERPFSYVVFVPIVMNPK